MINRPPRGFDDAEFHTRLLAAQRLMTERSLDALLLTTEPEIRYFTGFLTQFWHSPTRPWFLLVPRACAPVAVIPEIGRPLMETTWIEDVRSWESPAPEDEGVSLLARTIREFLGATGRLGVPLGPETTVRMAAADFDRLRQLLGTVEITDATDVVRSVRMVKSEAEIDKIRFVCAAASAAFDRVPGLVSPGDPLAEVFRRFQIELLAQGADAVPFLVGGAGPGGYGDIIGPPADAPVRAGDVLMMDTGAMYDGYWCDFDRNYSIGAADDLTRRGYNTLWRATEEAMSVARPGATCADLFRAMQKVIVEDGFSCGDVGRMGHGLGMQLTEWPSHRPDDHTVIEAGMVLTLEPSLWLAPGRSLVHEENLVVRGSGIELLTTRAPRDIPELG
ncbi:M24 family metallopeptidase [Streptomyces sp. SID8361]|uniref:M24 family metallopeptidase n=1 Tax=Streptomyces sp. MnatMP-M27 TaxID=1839768 RepID=UPI00081F5B7A|nr:Xaa-Pro peptidase family protein [Streptomyces sp. MnatMP-M27]MYU10525.1 M24 family metallopeptidase [Streptomyces sp. SID8361]SCF72827.1 Xaa-Pro aminopeptidase [Streptomyces sp. MnatMP-M27]